MKFLYVWVLFPGVILDYLLESIPNLVPPFLSVSVYHWMTGLVYSVLAYRYVFVCKILFNMKKLSPISNKGAVGMGEYQ